MKITFLGTGTSQGVPVIACSCNVCKSINSKDKRLRSSIMIELNENIFVIDAGPDFRQQMLRENVQRLDAILLTHGHKDHIGGLDDIRAFNYLQKKPIDIYAQHNVHSVLRSDFFYAFDDDKYPGVPEMNLHNINNRPFRVNNYNIIPIETLHYRLPVLGFRIGDFTYITDANYIEDKELEKIRGSQIIVINALRRQQHLSHFTLSEAIQVLQKLKPRQAYLTHISHQMGLHDEVEKELPSFVSLAYDGLTIKL